MKQPAKHFRPQTRRAQLRVVQAIAEVEKATLPPDFDSHAVFMDNLHFQSVAHPLAHDLASVQRLQEQVQRAELQQRMHRLASLPLAPLNEQHMAVIRQHQANRLNTDTLATPPEVTEPFMQRARADYRATTAQERFWLYAVIGGYLATIVALVAVSITYGAR